MTLESTEEERTLLRECIERDPWQGVDGFAALRLLDDIDTLLARPRRKRAMLYGAGIVVIAILLASSVIQIANEIRAEHQQKAECANAGGLYVQLGSMCLVVPSDAGMWSP